MRRIAPFHLLNLASLTLILLIFIFLPSSQVTPDKQPAVKSISTTRLTLPILIGRSAPDISAQTIYIYDPDSGTTLYEKNAHTHFFPASTTKLITALVASRVYQHDQVLGVQLGARAIGSKVGLRAGEHFTVENLLYGLLIDSGNDAALVLAENYPTGYSGFIVKMNDLVHSLGLTETHFTNASGVEGQDHYTSAHDLSLIAHEAISDALIRKIVATKSAVISDVEGIHRYRLESTNKLLGLDGVKGLKTGWTPESGECLVTLVTRDGHSVIITILDSQDRFGDSETLIDWVYQNFQWREI